MQTALQAIQNGFKIRHNPTGIIYWMNSQGEYRKKTNKIADILIDPDVLIELLDGWDLLENGTWHIL